jgi:putative intracellular protease/amidase
MSKMVPDETFDEVPHPYAIVVPGGRIPTIRTTSDPAMRAYLRRAADSAEIVASACTGSLMLASLDSSCRRVSQPVSRWRSISWRGSLTKRPPAACRLR